MEIVVLDGYMENPGNLSWGELEKLGGLTVYDRTSIADENEIISRTGGAEVVITNKTPIIENITDACPGTRYVAMLAVNYNMMDYVYAREEGIPLSNVPSYGTAFMGQFVTAMLLELCHHVAHHNQTVHEGKREHCQDWYYWDYSLTELGNKTTGIIGFGRIGQQTGKVTKTMGMNILAYDNYPSESGREIAGYVDLDTLYAKSDAIALHCPLFPETQGIINEDAIAKMRDGVMILNNSRGSLIVKQDLAGALSSGGVSGAGLDVVSTEPIKGNNPLLKTKNCIITSHISWVPKEGKRRIMDHTIESVKAYLAGAPIYMAN